MKRKVKKYAGGTLVDSSGNPVRSGSGEVVRTRFGKDDAEDRPKSSGIEDYASMGRRASAVSTFGGPKEYISESSTEDVVKEPMSDTEEPRRKISDYISNKSTSSASEDEKPAVKKKVIKKVAAKTSSQSFPTRDDDRGSQAFPIRGDDKKVPPLRKIGEAIMGTMENRPFRSSMYDKMKGRKAGGSVKMASGGKVSSASSRGDGIAQRGKTKGRIC
jgi:hypothetical protein